MTKEQLEAIRAALAEPLRVPSDREFDCTQLVQCYFDRAALLAEVDLLTAENERLRAALPAIRLYLQDCVGRGFDNSILGSLMAARDEVDAALEQKP